MKTRIYSIALVMLMGLGILSAQAQVSRTSYFMEGAPYRHLMNPAMSPARGYVSLPVLGNMNFGMDSNLGLTNFLFYDQTNDRLLTALHPDVTDRQFLDGLNDNNNLGMHLRTDLVSFGFWAGHGFVTADVSLRAQAGLNVPKDFFAFLKKGMANGSGTHYNINNFGLNASAFAEFALGYSYDIFDNLRVGGKVKALFGMAGASAHVDQMDINMSDKAWSIASDASFQFCTPLQIGLDTDPADGYISGLTMADGGIQVGDLLKTPGKGVAFDLGVTYSPFDFLTISTSLTDIGKIKWDANRTLRGVSQGSHSFEGIEGLSLDGESQDIEDQLQSISDDLMNMIQFREANSGDFATKLHTTFNFGVEGRLLDNRLSGGLLYTHRRLDFDGLDELTAVANVRLIKPVQLSASATLLSQYGSSFGLSLDLLNVFYIAWEGILINYTPNYIPLDALNSSLQMGVVIPLAIKKTENKKPSLLYFGD